MPQNAVSQVQKVPNLRWGLMRGENLWSCMDRQVKSSRAAAAEKKTQGKQFGFGEFHDRKLKFWKTVSEQRSFSYDTYKWRFFHAMLSVAGAKQLPKGSVASFPDVREAVIIEEVHERSIRKHLTLFDLFPWKFFVCDERWPDERFAYLDILLLKKSSS